MNNEIGFIVKSRLKELNHNTRWLALQTEIPECTLSRYINGNRVPNVDNFAKICMALDLSADEILGLE